MENEETAYLCIILSQAWAGVLAHPDPGLRVYTAPS